MTPGADEPAEFSIDDSVMNFWIFQEYFNSNFQYLKFIYEYFT
jgi:hypothetical protein